MPAERGKVETATAKACAACPWRLANQGKRTPDGWYTKANLQRLWSKLRRGEAMTCHPTDPSNPVSERQQQAGHKPANCETPTRECAGALTLVQREFMVVQDYLERHDEFNEGMAAYRRDRPRGLTRDGIAEVISRAVYAGVPVVGGAPMPKPDLSNAELGYPPLDGWEPALERGAAK